MDKTKGQQTLDKLLSPEYSNPKVPEGEKLTDHDLRIFVNESLFQELENYKNTRFAFKTQNSEIVRIALWEFLDKEKKRIDEIERQLGLSR